MRSKNTFRNFLVGVIGQIIIVLLSFINRTVFIFFLGEEYLGISGLFSNILSMLSLAELGVGVAIVYNLYKPIANDDIKQIKALMNFYKIAYRFIGIIIFVLGIGLIPFLDLLIKDKPNIDNFILIYVLFTLNSVVSYFFTYKRSLLSANQKEYENTINRTVFMFIQNILQIIILILTRNYIFYLIIVVICTIISNISISFKCDKYYPYLKNNKEKLSREQIKLLMKHVFAQMSHKIGGVVVSGTDNILISTFIPNGIKYVGYYSNYLLLINVIKNIINIFFSSVMASIGNLNAENNEEKSKKVFNEIFFLNFIFYGISAGCILYLINDFILLWIGEKFLLPLPVVFLIVLNYYISGMRQTCITYNTTLGLFWNDRFKPWGEAIINIIGSIIMVKIWGLSGVFLGTLLSTVTTSFWIEPYILYKYSFKTKLVDYFIRYAKYSFSIVIANLVLFIVLKGFVVNSWISWIIKAMISFIILFSVVIICSYRSLEFTNTIDRFKDFKNNIR